MGLLRHLHPLQRLYTGVVKSRETSLLGSVLQTPGESFARILYLAPETHLTHPSVLALLEHLATQAGAWGALHLLAEVDENSEAFPMLRSTGFSVYAWQRMWLLPLAGPTHPSGWRATRPSDWWAIQSLYAQIVPPLLQAIEPPPRLRHGLLRRQPALCYVGLSKGWAGAVIIPFIPPDVEEAVTSLAALAGDLSRRGTRPVYVRVRSYQAWLEPMLEDLGAQTGSRKAVMVKHLAHRVREEQPANAVRPSAASIQPSTMAETYPPSFGR